LKKFGKSGDVASSRRHAPQQPSQIPAEVKKRKNAAIRVVKMAPLPGVFRNILYVIE
jgi:hypothetical protein